MFSSRNLLLFSLILFFHPTFGQGIPAKPPTGNPINFTSDKADFLQVNGKTIGHLRSNGNPCRFFQGNAIMTSDSAILFQDDNKLNAYGHVVIHQADTITITGDRLYYDGNTRKAQLYDHITMTDRQGVLTTDHLDYDLNTKIGTYYDGGRITNKDNILLSRTGYYFESTKVAYFKTKVSILTPQTTITSDTLQYNTVSRIAYFFGPTRIVGKDDFIYCENGEYNTSTDQAKFSRHAYYLSGSKKLYGDSLYYDKRVGYGKAVRNVFFIDSVEKAYLYGGIAVYDKSTEVTYATIKPLAILLTQSQDTVNSYTDTLLDNKAPIKLSKLDIKKKESQSPGKIKNQSLNRDPNNLTTTSKIRIIQDTLIAVKPEKGKRKLPKGLVLMKHWIQKLVDKEDSVFLTGDSLKTEVVTGDRAKPHLFVKKTLFLKKTRFDSLDKKAIKLLRDIRNDVLEDSLKKLPGYKPKLNEKSFSKRRDSGLSQIISIAKGKGEINKKKLDTLPMANQLENQRVQNPKIEQDSILKRKRVRKGFFARVFGSLFSRKIPKVPSADSLARRRLDSMSKRAKIQIPNLLEGVPGNSDLVWKELFIEGKKKMIRYEDTAHYRILFANNHARMYKSDLQSAADSMVFTYYDSTLRCFKKPVIWTEGSQMSSDTLSLSLKNQKLDSLSMIRSSFIISRVDSLFHDKFHQISGRNMFGRFKNNNLIRLLVEGNAKSLYYAVDEKKDTISGKIEKKLIGLNTTVASYFLIHFKDNHPNRINTVENPVSHLYPMKGLSTGKERLSGFYWRESERPKSRVDLFRRPSPSEIAEDTLINKKSVKADSLDDSSPNILDIPKPVIKKAKPRFIPSNSANKPSKVMIFRKNKDETGCLSKPKRWSRGNPSFFEWPNPDEKLYSLNPVLIGQNSRNIPWV